MQSVVLIGIGTALATGVYSTEKSVHFIVHDEAIYDEPTAASNLSLSFITIFEPIICTGFERYADEIKQMVWKLKHEANLDRVRSTYHGELVFIGRRSMHPP